MQPASKVNTINYCMEYNVYQYLDRRSKTKENKHPVKIAIGYNRKVDYVHTDCYITVYEWNLLSHPKCPRSLIEIKEAISSIESKVKHYLSIMLTYDITKLRVLVKGEEQKINHQESTLHTNPHVSQSLNVFDWFDLKIKELEEKQAYGTRDNYIDTKSFLIKFTGLSNVEFNYFTKEHLYRIQQDALRKGTSISNVYRHARHLRAVFNMAIADLVLDKRIYPFHKRGYIIGSSRKAKKGLTAEALNTFVSAPATNEEEQKALDFFIFSFYGNGMNMKDVAYLGYLQIWGRTLRFYRQKTANTLSEPKQISVYLTDEMLEVIRKHGISPTTEGYVFPIINANDTVEKQRIDYRNFNRWINKRLKARAMRLGIDAKITHGVSRHSFANALLQEGATKDYIGDALGHTSTKTTEHYLSGFEETVISNHAAKLSAFVAKGITSQKMP